MLCEQLKIACVSRKALPLIYELSKLFCSLPLSEAAHLLLLSEPTLRWKLSEGVSLPQIWTISLGQKLDFLLCYHPPVSKIRSVISVFLSFFFFKQFVQQLFDKLSLDKFWDNVALCVVNPVCHPSFVIKLVFLLSKINKKPQIFLMKRPNLQKVLPLLLYYQGCVRAYKPTNIV